MIDLISKYFDNEKAIKDYILGRKEAYFNSDTYTRLKRRYEKLRDSYNLKIGNNNFRSKIVLPLVKEQVKIRRGLTLQNFRADPPVSLEPILDTPFESSQNMQMVLNMNLKHTEWRRRVWRPTVDFASIFGTAIVYAYYHEDNQPISRTITDGFGIAQRVQVPQETRQVRHAPIHLLNYFQNPNIVDPEESDFQGHIENRPLSEIVDAYNNSSDVYIQANLFKVIRDIRRSQGYKDNRYYDENKHDRDENRFGVDVTKWWGRVHIMDNEDDKTVYYCEMINDTIIRFQADVYDQDYYGRSIRPYAIFNYYKRFDYWWGNAEGEDIMPHENYMNLLLSISADSALQSTQRIRLYQKGTIDPAAIANQFINNGWVPIDAPMNTSIDKLIYEFQQQERSLNGTDYMMREMKESASRLSAKTDLSRPSTQGGPQNKTATGANIIQGEKDCMEADCLESFSYGLEHQGLIDCVLLQQFLGDEILVRPGIKEVSKVLRKADIMGSFSMSVKTALQKNNIMEAQRVMNGLTQMINLVGTGRPEFQNINLGKLGREMYRQLDLPDDVDDVMPENIQGAPGYQPSALPQQAQQVKGRAMVGPQGAQPAPQPQPQGAPSVAVA